MKKTRSIIAVIIAVALIVPIAFAATKPVTTYAKDVTTTISKTEKVKLKRLTNQFHTAALAKLAFEMESCQTKTYDFSKKKNRKAILKYMYDPNVAPKEKAKRVFGKAVTGVEYLEGDWGESGPATPFKKIYKVGKKYKIVMAANLVSTSGDTTNYGTIVMVVKPKKDSYYGYVATKMTLKKK